jgi:hypothetical protein
LVLVPVAAAVTCGKVFARPSSPTDTHHTARTSQLLLLLLLGLSSAAALAATAAAPAAEANGECALPPLLPPLLLLLLGWWCGLSSCQRICDGCLPAWCPLLNEPPLLSVLLCSVLSCWVVPTSPTGPLLPLLLLLGMAVSVLVLGGLSAVSCWALLSLAGSCLLLLLLLLGVVIVTARRCRVMLRVLLNWAAPAQQSMAQHNV